MWIKIKTKLHCFGILMVNSYFFCPFDLKILRLITLILTWSINALIIFFVQFDEGMAPCLTSNIIRCLIHHIFFIKQPVQKLSALVLSISKWATDRRLRDWIDKITMNRFLYYVCIAPISKQVSKIMCLFSSFVIWPSYCLGFISFCTNVAHILPVLVT